MWMKAHIKREIEIDSDIIYQLAVYLALTVTLRASIV